MVMKRLLGILVLVLLASSCTVGEQPPGPVAVDRRAAEAPSSKRIVAGIAGRPAALNARVNAWIQGPTPGAEALAELVHAGLVSVDNQGRLFPQLAEEVPSIENGGWKVFPDGRMETTWRIRPGIIWHDGRPFSADDLLFTYRVMQDRAALAFADTASPYIEEIAAPDPQTVVVRWQVPYIEANELFSRVHGHVLPLPEHILQGMYEEEPEALADAPYWREDFVGLGPFSVDRFDPRQALRLRSTNYWTLGQGPIDEIEVRFFDDAAGLIQGVTAGDVHVTLGGGFSLQQALDVRDQWKDGQIIFSYVSWQALYPQTLEPNPRAIADYRFRRGLLEAIDRQALVDDVMAGLVPVAHVYLSPQDRVYADVANSVIRHSFDPGKAEQDLQDAGVVRGLDGEFPDFTGAPLPEIEIRTTSRLETPPTVMEAVAEDWRRTGLGVDTVVIPPDAAADREFRATMPGFELARQPNDVNVVSRLHSGQAPLPENDFTGANRARYRNFEMDILLDRYIATMPSVDRVDVLRQIVRRMTDQVVWLGLFYDVDPIMVDNHLKNVGGRGALATQAWNATQWDLQ
jgi:peptide/nickel transport system substrate-binding protein